MYKKRMILLLGLCTASALVGGSALASADTDTSAIGGANYDRHEISEPALSVNFPNGGETISQTETVNIYYALSRDLQANLTSDDVVELYLLNDQGIVVGYIGEITNGQANAYTWKVTQLQHWGGLDTTVSAPQPGKYRILLVARPRAEISADAVERPVDILHDGYTIYDDQRKALHTLGDRPVFIQVLASDVSDETFQIGQ